MTIKNDETDVLPIDLDRGTIRRLKELAELIGAHPREVASSLLHDIVRSDDLVIDVSQSRRRH